MAREGWLACAHPAGCADRPTTGEGVRTTRDDRGQWPSSGAPGALERRPARGLVTVFTLRRTGQAVFQVASDLLQKGDSFPDTVARIPIDCRIENEYQVPSCARGDARPGFETSAGSS